MFQNVFWRSSDLIHDSSWSFNNLCNSQIISTLNATFKWNRRSSFQVQSVRPLKKRLCNAFKWYFISKYAMWILQNYFLAKEIFMECVGVILKEFSASRAAPLWISEANSTKAMSCRPGTKRTSLNPGNWLNSMLSIISLVSSGRFVRKRIWFGGCSAFEEWIAAWAGSIVFGFLLLKSQVLMLGRISFRFL